MIVHREYKSPMTVHFELTSACNHKCIHCYNYWREPGSPTAVMKRDVLHRLFDNMIACDMQNLVLTGGEPLLYPELLYETMDLARKANIGFSLNTNVSLLTDEIAEELKKRSAFLLTSFLSHDPKTFDYIVSREGAFDKVVSGIQTAMKHGLGITANMVVMKTNAGHVFETGRFLKSLGINKFSATKVSPATQTKKFESLKLSHQELRAMYDALLSLRDEEGMDVDTLTPCPTCFFDDIGRFGNSIVKRSCSAGKTMGAIGVDGSVRACPQSDIVYGNALTESLYDIWPRLKGWRDGSMLPHVCQDCELLQMCGGGCRVDSIFYHKELDGIDPYAITPNAEKIDIPQNKNNSQSIGLDTKLRINPRLRFRDEKFGVYINFGGQSPVLVTKATGTLLKELAGYVFCVNDILKQYELNEDNARSFIGSLAAQGVLHFVQDEIHAGKSEPADNMQGDEDKTKPILELGYVLPYINVSSLKRRNRQT